MRKKEEGKKDGKNARKKHRGKNTGENQRKKTWKKKLSLKGIKPGTFSLKDHNFEYLAIVLHTRFHMEIDFSFPHQRNHFLIMCLMSTFMPNPLNIQMKSGSVLTKLWVIKSRQTNGHTNFIYIYIYIYKERERYKLIYIDKELKK